MTLDLEEKLGELLGRREAGEPRGQQPRHLVADAVKGLPPSQEVQDEPDRLLLGPPLFALLAVQRQPGGLTGDSDCAAPRPCVAQPREDLVSRIPQDQCDDDDDDSDSDNDDDLDDLDDLNGEHSEGNLLDSMIVPSDFEDSNP